MYTFPYIVNYNNKCYSFYVISLQLSMKPKWDPAEQKMLKFLAMSFHFRSENQSVIQQKKKWKLKFLIDT